MEHSVIFRGEEVSGHFIRSRVNEIVELMKEHGIYKKDLVLCRADTQIGIYLQWVACKEAGVLPVCAFSEYSLESMEQMKRNIPCKAILVSKGMESNVYMNEHYRTKPEFFDNIEKGSVIHMTSATTGMPKLVLRTKSQLEAELKRYSSYLHIDNNDIILPIVPINHSFGFISGMLLSCMVNATLVLPDMLLPRNIIQLSCDSKATMMLGVPYFYKKMLKVSDKYQLNDELRYIIASGGAMEEGLQAAFFERFNKTLAQQYGSTETGSLCLDLEGKQFDCVGKPIPGVHVYFELDKEERKCIYVDTKDTIGSYILEDRLELLNKEPYKMNDVGIEDQDGNIRLVGRVDDILIVDGKKVNKKYVESVISQIDAIEEACVYLADREDANELTCEYISKESIPRRDLIESCRKVLGDFQIPKNFIRTKELSKKRKNWKTE